MSSSLSQVFNFNVVQGNTTSDVSSTSAGTTTVTKVGTQVTKTTFNYDATLVKQYVNKSLTVIANNQNAGINALALTIPEYPFGDPYFELVVLNSYMDELIAGANTIGLEPLDTYKYAGDFYGILNALDIPLEYHPLILRMNGFSDTGLYDPTIQSIIVPNLSTVDDIASVYANTVPSPF